MFGPIYYAPPVITKNTRHTIKKDTPSEIPGPSLPYRNRDACQPG